MPATKEQIAQAFERQVQHFGYGRASVEDVAAELGISKRTIYQHFSSKRDLYAHIVERVADEERQRLVGAIEDAGTVTKKMERFLRLVVGGMRAHIQATSKADWMQEFEVAYDAMARAYGSVATELIAAGVASGEFAKQDPAFANDLVGAMITHYGMSVRDDRDLDADEALVAAIMRMLGASSAKPRKR